MVSMKSGSENCGQVKVVPINWELTNHQSSSSGIMAWYIFILKLTHIWYVYAQTVNVI